MEMKDIQKVTDKEALYFYIAFEASYKSAVKYVADIEEEFAVYGEKDSIYSKKNLKDAKVKVSELEKIYQFCAKHFVEGEQNIYFYP